jgi:hypothetical protein
MKARTTVILAVVVLALVLIAVLSNRTERSHEQLAAGPIFPELSRDAVTGIWMTAGGDTAHLIRESGRWLVATEGDYRADTTQVERILDQIPNLDVKHLRSRNPEMQQTFEVDDSSGTEVVFLGASGQSLAHFRMGKNGRDYRSQYVRPVDSDCVYLIPAYLKSTFDAQRATWRDRTIFTFDMERVSRVLITPAGADEIFILKDDADNYVMTAPDSGAVKKNLIESTLRTLANLRCDAFPDSVPSVAEAGLAPPRERIEIFMEDGAALALSIGNEVDEVRHYVKKDGDETLFLLSKGRVKNLIRTVDELKEEPPEPAEEIGAPEGTGEEG